MRGIRLARLESFIITWLLVLTMLGYPLIALIPSIMDKASTFASIPYRFIMIALALFIFLIQLIKGASAWRLNALLKMFIAIYFFRLVWDLVYMDIPNASHALLFFIVVCMIPALAIGKAGPSALNESKLAARLILIGSVVCGVAVTTYLLDIGLNRSLMASTGRLSFEALNPISLGYVAVTTMVAFVWLSIRQCWPLWRMCVFYVMVVPVALSCLLLASSRGPIVAFEVCMLWLLLVNRNLSSWIHIICIMTVVLFFIYHDNGGDIYSDTHIFGNVHTRFTHLLKDNSVFDRMSLLKQATELFTQSPWIGSGYIDYNTYPHNIFFEAAMSLGVVGLLLLFVTLIKGASYLNPRSDKSKSILAVLFIEYFINSQLSSSLWGMAELWALLVLITAQSRSTPVRFLYKLEHCNQTVIKNG